YARYKQLCDLLFNQNLFDCNNFANAVPPASNKQCCVEETTWGNTCAADDILPGCREGTFILNLTTLDESEPVLSTQLYGAMPRMQAIDKVGGNVIRSGSIADKDLLLGINFPLFDYYDKAFLFFEKLVFEGSPSYRDGMCSGPSCSSLPGMTQVSEPGATDRDRVKAALHARLTEACNAVHVTNEFEVYFCPTGSTCHIDALNEWASCADIPTAADDALFNPLDLSEVPCSPGSTDNCVVAGADGAGKKYQFLFVDVSGQYQVNSYASNKFCWNANAYLKGSPEN
ncbi:MAG: hypothetical protein V1834_03215, partial [Candidatus Micrarchaeota archaeon]